MNSKRKASRESGIAAGDIVVVIVSVTLIAAVSLYLLTPQRSPAGGGENVEAQIRHLVSSPTGDANVGTGVGNIAPNFVDQDDNTFSLTSLRSKVAVLDFMAAWCSPCITEMSHLKEIFSSYSENQVVIISSMSTRPKAMTQ